MYSKLFITAHLLVFMCLFYNVHPLSLRNTVEVKPPFTLNVTVNGYLNANAFSRLFKATVLYVESDKCFEEKKKSTYLMECKSSSSKPKEKDFTFKNPVAVNCAVQNIDRYEGSTDDYYFSCALKNNSTQEIVDIATYQIPNYVWSGILSKLLFVLLMVGTCYLFSRQGSLCKSSDEAPSEGNVIGYAPVPTDTH